MEAGSLTTEIRPINLPADMPAVLAIDTSFETDFIYIVEHLDEGFQFTESASRFAKGYAIDTDHLTSLSEAHLVLVAEVDGLLVGLAAAEYSNWNRRVVLHHLYVAPEYRRCGIGLLLLDRVERWCLLKCGRCVWLETQNVNLPAIQFYRKAGYRLCGFDTQLYDPAAADPREAALFFARNL